MGNITQASTSESIQCLFFLARFLLRNLQNWIIRSPITELKYGSG